MNVFDVFDQFEQGHGLEWRDIDRRHVSSMILADSQHVEQDAGVEAEVPAQLADGDLRVVAIPENARRNQGPHHAGRTILQFSNLAAGGECQHFLSPSGSRCA